MKPYEAEILIEPNRKRAVVTTESNRGSGSRMKMSWWNKIAKGLIKQKMKRKEDATGEENTPSICASKLIQPRAGKHSEKV